MFGTPRGKARSGGLFFSLSDAPDRARMRDRDRSVQILGITSPWHISDVRRDMTAGKLARGLKHPGLFEQVCC